MIYAKRYPRRVLFKTGRCLLFCRLLFLLIGGISTESPAQRHKLEPVFQAEKLRAAFLGMQSFHQREERTALLHEHGFNAALIVDSTFPVRVEAWKEWATLAEKYAIQLFPVLNFAGGSELEALRGTYTPYLRHDGVTLASTPCPVDGEYWKRSIAERLAQLARLSLSAPVSGALFDTEMYDSDISVYDGPCFCDRCWTEFWQTAVLSDPVSAQHHDAYHLTAERRSGYLARHRLHAQYAAFQEARLQKLLARIERHIHAIAPEFQLGFLAYVDNWFYRALIRGLGTPERPALVFSESWYARGYSSLLLEEHAAILALDSPPRARYLPGLWLGRFFPEDIASQLYHMALQTDGYWVFTAESLWSRTPLEGDYTLHGSPDAYWKAIKQANTGLQIVGEAGTQPSSAPIAPIFPSSVYDSRQQRLIVPASLQQFFHERQAAEGPAPEKLDLKEKIPVLFTGTTLFHCARQSGSPGDETLRLSRAPSTGPGERAEYKLFDVGGRLVRRDMLANDLTDLSRALSSGKFFSLLTESDAFLQMSFSGLSCLLEASSTFPLTISAQTAHFHAYGTPGKQRITLKAFSSGGPIPPQISLRLSRAKYARSSLIQGFHEMSVPLSKPREPVNISLHSSEAESTILLYLYDEKFPYLLP